MKKIAFTFAALGLTSACVMAPENVTAEDLVAFDEAVASIGCDLVGESDYLPVELQTGLTREKVIEVAQYKVAREEAVSLSNGGVRSVVGACTVPEEPAKPAA
ncbi:MAG: hypothetical protein N4A70_07945 [Pelagimonas sp.]|jgi:hypothetical protein|nr:hypothetical protein [Pelagimonas sp.]